MYQPLPKQVRQAIAKIETCFDHITGFYPNEVQVAEEFRGNAFWRLGHRIWSSDLTSARPEVIESVLIVFDGEGIKVEGLEEVKNEIQNLEESYDSGDRNAHSALKEIRNVLTVAKNWRP